MEKTPTNTKTIELPIRSVTNPKKNTYGTLVKV